MAALSDRRYRRLRAFALTWLPPVCAFCHEPVDLSIAWPDKMSATVDHTTPRSWGGQVYDVSNMRMAHLKCNSANGARLARAPLPSRDW
jgi:hypothetical protein